jgi:hypothetical protein
MQEEHKLSRNLLAANFETTSASGFFVISPEETVVQHVIYRRSFKSWIAIAVLLPNTEPVI